MKSLIRSVFVAFLIMLTNSVVSVMAQSAGSPATPSPSQMAVITSVTGEAYVVNKDGTKTAAKVGMVLQPGQVVMTSDNAQVGIKFADSNGSLLVTPNSQLRLDSEQVAQNGGNALNYKFTLLSGKVDGKVNFGNSGSSLAIATQNGVQTFKNGSFSLSSDGAVGPLPNLPSFTSDVLGTPRTDFLSK